MPKPTLILLLACMVYSVEAQMEKVYLHTDRTTYYAGDTAWFKAYLIEASTRLSSETGRNLHVELISPASLIVSSKIIRIEDGCGNGEMVLPADLSSGRYGLRTYTHFMRNAGDQLFYTKEIILVNPSLPDPDPVKSIPYDSRIQVYFFPEGGSLVDSVSSKVAFKAVDALGKGYDTKGKVFSSAGDLITPFASTHLGMGYFFLKPVTGVRYFAIFKNSDSIDIRIDLPASHPRGVSLGIVPLRNDTLLVALKTNSVTQALLANRNLRLGISARGDTLQTMDFRITDRLTTFRFPVCDLPDGILAFTLTAPGLPLAERLVFVQKGLPPVLSIRVDKSVYEKRALVSLGLTLNMDSTLAEDAEVSLAVTNTLFTDNSSRFPRNISSWFLLESDVRGDIEEPSRYFDPSNPNRLKELDVLLLTQGWRDFKWKYYTLLFPPEDGFTISGRLRRMYADKAIGDSRISVGIVQNDRNLFFTTPVDSVGGFSISGLYFTGEAQIIVSGIGKKDHFRGLLQLDWIPYEPPKVPAILPISRFMDKTSEDNLKAEYRLNQFTQRQYSLSDTFQINDVVVVSQKPKTWQDQHIGNSRVKYGKPDYEVIIEEQMTGYPYLIEVLRGRIPGTEIQGTFPKYTIRVRSQYTFLGSTGILVLVNGIQASFDDLIYTPISFVDRIDILQSIGSAGIFGMKGANGVINIITKTSQTNLSPVSYSANFKLQGYAGSKVFFSPQHSPDFRSPFLPDLRSTLYWAPQIRLECNKTTPVFFFNGDISAQVQITAEGMTEAGIPVTGRAGYEIISAMP